MIYDECGILIFITYQFSCVKLRSIIWDTWLNHFWVINQLYLIFFPVTLRGPRCSEWFVLDDVMLWHVWLEHFRVFNQYYFGILSSSSLRTNGYCDLSFDVFQLLIENYCDYYDCLLVLSSFSWRIDVNTVDYLWCFLVTCIGLRWFYMNLWLVISWAWPN